MILAHVACSLLSYAAFLLACVAGGLFLVQERQLKRKTLGVLFRRLPSLDALDRMNFIAISAGFGLLSLGLACGMAETRLVLGRWWTGDPKEVFTWLVWAAYSALWLIRLRSTLRGHRVALLSMLGFTLLMLTAVGAARALGSTHPFS